MKKSQTSITNSDIESDAVDNIIGIDDHVTVTVSRKVYSDERYLQDPPVIHTSNMPPHIDGKYVLKQLLI